MAKRNRNPAITAKMYRHFAVITVAFTATLAIFADGENRQVIAEEVAAQEAKIEAARIQSMEKPELVVSKSVRKRGTGFGKENDPTFGQPTTRLANSGGVLPDGFTATQALQEISGGVPAGMDPHRWASMSDAERAAYLAYFKNKPMVSKKELESRREAMMEASARRARGG